MMKMNLVLALLLTASGCDNRVRSVSGVEMATAGKVTVDPTDNKTIEQHNVAARIALDNTPGAIKHLYVISAYSGQVLIYSTVRGKVTSSGKRLTPDRVEGASFTFDVSGNQFSTSQVLGEDGTYGPSIDYLYWWDAKGVYHQHYVTGGQIVHISDQPLAVKGVLINMELSKAE